MQENTSKKFEGVKMKVAPGDGWQYTAIIAEYMNGKESCHQFMIKVGDHPCGGRLEGFLSDYLADRIIEYALTLTKQEWLDSHILNYTLGKIHPEVNFKYWDDDYLTALGFVLCAATVRGADAFYLAKKFKSSWFDD